MNNMQNETQIFPPKEVAIELYKVGFDWDCVGFYSSKHDEVRFKSYGVLMDESLYPAPTYDQVIGWFAEVHGIEILLASKWHGYQYEIIVKGDDELVPNKIVNYETRQQSLLTAFREAIKLIEK